MAIVFLGVTGFGYWYSFLCIWYENIIISRNFLMDLTPTIDLAGLCLVCLVHAGILALRLGVSLQRT